MSEDANEPFSNPVAPVELKQSSSNAAATKRDHQPLTNEDFRKLVMTPRHGAVAGSVRGDTASKSKFKKPAAKDDADDNKNKKKKFFQAMKKQEEDTLAELSARYRDRARERRDNKNPDYNSEDPASSIPSYRAVAPDSKSVTDAAEKRKQMIDESKFLGGDMAHTHLVKGLDFALLHKVKAEIAIRDEDEDGEENDDIQLPPGDDSDPLLPDIGDKDLDEWEVKSPVAKSICAVINKKLPDRNDLFLSHRMAYRVDLEDECADDIPTTIIRSKADCPNWDSITAQTTNDIVINKLTQILSYIRQGGGKKKKKEKDKPSIDGAIRGGEAAVVKQEKMADLDDGGIYGEDIGDYKPSFVKREPQTNNGSSSKDKRHRDMDGDSAKSQSSTSSSAGRKRDSSYFDVPSSSSGRDRDNLSTFAGSREMLQSEKGGQQSFSKSMSFVSPEEAAKVRGKLSTLDGPDSYAECYPGAPENADAIIDSDDEVDYSKMDMGNKKGNVNRWDFDTAEEYGDYMSKVEAMPKAAFNFGLKISDGRKTRGKPKKDDKKAKLDRDFQKINALISKRKTESTETGRKINFQTPAHQPDYKRKKH